MLFRRVNRETGTPRRHAVTSAGNKSHPAAPEDPRLRFLSGGLLATGMLETRGGICPAKAAGLCQASRRKDVPTGSCLQNRQPALPTHAPGARGGGGFAITPLPARGEVFPLRPPARMLGSKYLLAAAGEGQDAELQTVQIPASRGFGTRLGREQGAIPQRRRGIRRTLKVLPAPSAPALQPGFPSRPQPWVILHKKQIFPAAPPGAVSAAKLRPELADFIAKKAGGSGSGFALVAAGTSAPRSGHARGGRAEINHR